MFPSPAEESFRQPPRGLGAPSFTEDVKFYITLNVCAYLHSQALGYRQLEP